MTAIFHFCSPPHRYPSHQSGCGPSSDSEGARRCCHPPAQPHYSLLLICQGSVDSEYNFSNEWTVVVCFFSGSDCRVDRWYSSSLELQG